MTSSFNPARKNLELPTTHDANPLPKPSSTEKKLKFIIGLPHTPQTNQRSTPQGHLMSDENRGNPFNLATPPPRLSVRINKGPRNTRVYHSTELGRIANIDEADDSDNYKKHLAAPYEREKIVSQDEDPQNILGDEAVNQFYLHYKQLDKIKDINSFTQVRDATYTSILGKSESLNLLPSKMGFIRERGDANKVKLNHFGLGDKYAEVLSEGIRSVKGLNRLELANNRLTPAGANHVLSNLNHLTEYIDLSKNNIGRIGCDHLVSIAGLKNSKLLEMNLEGNKLGDTSIGNLCDALGYNNSIRKLNVSKNFLSDKAAEKIGKMLELNSSLEELYIHWNQIKGAGGVAIVNGLKSASKLRVLDFSWNSLGQGIPSAFAKAFGPYIATNTTLLHLDLSNNYLNKTDSKIIAEDLKANHSLFGFHFTGNSGYVDYKGFLIIPDDQETELAGRIVQPPINSGKYQSESLKHYVGNWGEYKDCCWICEGWRPHEFTWRPYESGQGDRDPIHVHLSFEGYRQVYLPVRNEFTNVRMVPPTKFTYFFSVDTSQVHAEDQPTEKPENPSLKIKIDNEEKNIKLDLINICAKVNPVDIVDEDLDVLYEIRTLGIKPRIPDEVYSPAGIVHERPQWKFPASIFRQCKPDTQAFNDECFKIDFEGTRITKLVKDPEDLDKVRSILHEVYPNLKDCYKYYAAVGAPSDIWSIPLNTYTDFCNTCGIIDGKILKLSDFDRIFIATYTKSDKEKNHRNPDRALVRYQFLEGLVRIAEQKYVNSGLARNYAEGMTMLMEESVKPYVSKFNHHQWRPEQYWNEQVDTVYKSYLPIMRGIFKKYSGLKTMPGHKKFMCIEEFTRLMTDAEAFSDNFGERDATIAFSLSMMNQADELNSDRIYQMQFVEFLEAFARITEKVSPPPYGYNPINPETGVAETEMSYEQRSAQPLHAKLEGFMTRLFSLCGNEVKEIWSLPETSIFKMEELPPKQKFPTKKKKILRINPTHSSSIEPYDGVNALQV